MKQNKALKASIILILGLSLILSSCQLLKKQKNVLKVKNSWIRVNQLGYLTESVKVPVFCSKDIHSSPKAFQLVDANTHDVVFESNNIDSIGAYGPFAQTFRFNLSDFTKEGRYYIQANDVISPAFTIADDVYEGAADFLLRYMRQQRCGFNPYLNDSCHTDDGFIVYEKGREGEYIDVHGGWHDASDYLQYTATSANAVYQMLLAYREHPEAFADAYDAKGLPGANGIPDVIDEVKWGMDWLCRMNPAPERFFNQIADDRDHSGYRLPTEDSTKYHDEWEGRPVYFCTGEIQGLFEHKNRATGTASTAGKFASAFAAGSDLLKEFYPDYAETLKDRAQFAYAYGKKYPGACQTAPGGAPYFYEEDNWADDMELAAAEIYRMSGRRYFRNEVVKYADMEPVTPWMGADTARHYQWYPFFNAGHYAAASANGFHEKDKLTALYKEGLERIYQRGKDNPFLFGVPFIWCSNNFVTATLSQLSLYKKLSDDDTYDEMEAALRDWLFGCNIWGTSMIVGFPVHADNPSDPHSSLTHLYDMTIPGGLIDGPVYGSIFASLLGLQLHDEDEYAEFQSDVAVYHDDVGDYSTNEPTMDGTACLVYYLASLDNADPLSKNTVDDQGAVIRGPQKEKHIALVFTGHDQGDGGQIIADTLKAHDVKASFFFTGDFYRNTKFKAFIKQLVADGHYMGAHSDKHLLYNKWDKNRTLNVSEEEFKSDLEANYVEMEKYGITKDRATYFIPPYEWYNKDITLWAYQEGITLFNFTPGTLSNADYTTPDMGDRYHGNDEIYQSIVSYEENNGMNGFILLIHIGSDQKRTEKFYHELDELMNELSDKGYEFVKIDELLDKAYQK
ncbi:MAG: glycoside hydrolase family 9 protein [Candidatus Neomarinimicrobiota bacterium]